MDYCYSENEELATLRTAVENTNEAFITIDENHKVIFYNRAAEKIFGFKREDVTGNDLSVIMAPACSRDHRHAVERYVKTRIPTKIGHNTELLATRKDGNTFPANISFSVCEVEGKLYFTGIVSDLTEKKALQEQIIKSERLAALGQMVAEISHEIKNPLMMIGGFAKQLLRKHSEENTVYKLNIIADEVSRLEELLSELKQYYQPGALRNEKIDINYLLEEVFSLIKHECKEKKIIAELMKNEDSLIVEGDRDKLKQVFLNLIKNAIEAMKDGGRLNVQSKLNGNNIEVHIKDEGCGIPEDEIKNVFAPFYTTKRHGTGLGLSISKSIVEAHQGSSFTVENRKGKGTTVTIAMPVCGKDVKGN